MQDNNNISQDSQMGQAGQPGQSSQTGQQGSIGQQNGQSGQQSGTSQSSNTSPIELYSYLAGVTYPAQKEDIMEAARSNNAPEDVMQKIEQLPEGEEFESSTQVSQAFSESR